MKKTLLILASVLFSAITFAQTVPQGINYQAVARDANGNELTNQSLTVKLSVISSSTGTIPVLSTSWQETHAVTTNDYGLFTVVIGQGTSTVAGSFLIFVPIFSLLNAIRLGRAVGLAYQSPPPLYFKIAI